MEKHIEVKKELLNYLNANEVDFECWINEIDNVYNYVELLNKIDTKILIFEVIPTLIGANIALNANPFFNISFLLLQHIVLNKTRKTQHKYISKEVENILQTQMNKMEDYHKINLMYNNVDKQTDPIIIEIDQNLMNQYANGYINNETPIFQEGIEFEELVSTLSLQEPVYYENELSYEDIRSNYKSLSASNNIDMINNRKEMLVIEETIDLTDKILENLIEEYYSLNSEISELSDISSTKNVILLNQIKKRITEILFRIDYKKQKRSDLLLRKLQLIELLKELELKKQIIDEDYQNTLEANGFTKSKKDSK